MSSPYHEHVPDFEDEPRDIHIDPASLPRITEEEEPEEGPYESDPEEEPFEEDPEEAPSEDEPEDARPVSPVALPERTSPMRVIRDMPRSPPTTSRIPHTTSLVGESSRGVTRPRPDESPMRYTARMRVRSPERFSFCLDDTPTTYTLPGDPYRPPTSSTAPPQLPNSSRGTWIPSILRTWRHAEDRRVPEVGQHSATTPAHPVTGESLHDTVPLLIARSHTHDTQIEQIRSELMYVPRPDYILQLDHGLQTMATRHRALQDHHEQAVDRISSDSRRISQMERQLADLGEALDSLRTMMGEILDSVRHPTREDPRP